MDGVEAMDVVEEADLTMIDGSTNKTISIIRNNFKEKAEDVAATTQQIIDQSQQTSPMLSVTNVTGKAIISQSVLLV